MGVPTTATTTTNTSDAPDPTLSHAAADNPTEHTAADDASANTTTPTTPKTPADLPPEALDLAARLFDHARHGHTSTLTTYLAAGLPPNLTNHAGDTLLMLAAYHGHASTVQMLLARGADPNTLNARGQSPLAGAVFKGHADVVRALVGGGADPDAGVPCARDTAVLFKRRDVWGVLGVEEGRLVPGMVEGHVHGHAADGDEEEGRCPV